MYFTFNSCRWNVQFLRSANNVLLKTPGAVSDERRIITTGRVVIKRFMTYVFNSP